MVDHPAAGSYRQTTIPWKLSKSPRLRAVAASGLGEHNSYILGDLLGLTPGQLADLETEGVIGTRPRE